MIDMHFTIPGEPRTKKNSNRIIRVKSKNGGYYSKVVPSEAYEIYEGVCNMYIPFMAGTISTPVNLKCVYYMGSRRKVDLLNLLNATTDILVRYGVLADDNRNIVYSTDGSRVLYDKENPRVEITVTDAEDFKDWSKE